MQKKAAIKEIAIMAIFIALTAVLAQVAIPLPFTPVPISFALVAVYITGILLKPKHAVITQTCYLLLGAVGVPVFGNFRGGIAALFGPTGGYLMMYPAIAGIVAVALNSSRSIQTELNQSKKLIFIKTVVSLCAAQLLLYLGGTLWLCATTGNNFQAGLALAVYPYIPLDIVKLVFCVVSIVPLRSRFMSMNLLMLDYAPTGASKRADNNK